MPLFEYRCVACHEVFELLVRTGDFVLCSRCGGSDVEKLLSETAAGMTNSLQTLPIANSCSPGNAPCGPACCRLP